MFWTQLKTTAQMLVSTIRKGYLAVWFERTNDGTIVQKYKDDAGVIGTISGGSTGDGVTIVDGVWYIDGVSTGVTAAGKKGDKGDPGTTGYVTTVISADQPQNPVDGTIWIKP